MAFFPVHGSAWGAPPPYQNEMDARSGWSEASSTISSRVGSILGLQSQLKDLSARFYQLGLEIKHVGEERDAVVDELKRGLWCSQCGRSRMEIEKAGLNFYAHLQEVHGQPLPAPREKIEETEKKFQSQIDGLVANREQVRSSYNDRLLEDWRKDSQTLKNALSQDQATFWDLDRQYRKALAEGTSGPWRPSDWEYVSFEILSMFEANSRPTPPSSDGSGKKPPLPLPFKAN